MKVGPNHAQIKQAAEQWAQNQKVDLGNLTEAQTSQAITEVAQSTGLSKLEVMDALLAQGIASNEARGRQLEQQGGGGKYLGATDQRSVQGSPMGALINSKLEAKGVRTFGPDQLSFDTGKECVSSAQKFIIPIPKLADGGQAFVNPDTGGAITDWQGNAVEGKGFVFKNAKDDAWQAVEGDGNGVIICNQVTEEQAKKIQQKIGDPTQMDLAKLTEVLDFLHNDMGLDDTYNSDKGFIESKMNAMEQSTTGVEAFGLHRRDDRDLCQALLVEGKGQYQGPAATPQKFEDGAVMLKQGDDIRLIQPDIYLQTYSNKDGSPLSLDDLPVQSPGE